MAFSLNCFKVVLMAPETVRIKVIRNGSLPLAIAQPDLFSLHSDILAIFVSIYSADQILDL